MGRILCLRARDSLQPSGHQYLGAMSSLFLDRLGRGRHHSGVTAYLSPERSLMLPRRSFRRRRMNERNPKFSKTKMIQVIQSVTWIDSQTLGCHQQPLKGSRELTIAKRSQRIARMLCFFCFSFTRHNIDSVAILLGTQVSPLRKRHHHIKYILYI